MRLRRCVAPTVHTVPVMMLSPDFTVITARKTAAAAAVALLSLSIASVVAARSSLSLEHAIGRHRMPASRATAWATSSPFTCVYVSNRSRITAAAARAGNRPRGIQQRRQRTFFSRAGSQTVDGARLGVETAVMMATDAPGAQGYVVDSNEGRCNLDPLPILKNRYFALRHGQSVANMEGIISSDPEIGCTSHGLTSNGRAQARAAATALIEQVGRENLDSLVFISSGFLRARQTAEECRSALLNIIAYEREATASENGEQPNLGGVGSAFSPPLVIRKELRERWFGELEGTILVNYNKVWPEDLKDGRQDGYGVESVCDVASRIGGLVRSLEQEYQDACIVFSSHADTLQICQCHIAGADERLFSQYRFKNGEVRKLLQDTSSLPPPQPLSFK